MAHGSDIADLAVAYESTHGGKHISYAQMECNQFVVAVLKEIDPSFPYVLANDFPGTGYFHKLDAKEIPRRGDLIHWHDHIAIVLNGDTGEFIGSQTRNGVSTANFKNGYWDGLYGGKKHDYFLRWSHP